MVQAQLFSQEAQGDALKQTGMQQAVDHADQAVPYNWSDKAYAYLVNWLGTLPSGYPFLLEDARIRSEILGTVPQPPHKRAWGAIVAKASREGLIYSIGTNRVKNPKAHRANATQWVKY